MSQTFFMDKSKVVNFLIKSQFLLPGTFDAKSRWFCSTWTILSISGIIITTINAILVALDCEKIVRNNNCNGKGPPFGGPHPPPLPTDLGNVTGAPSVVVDIAISSSRNLGIVVNLCVRIISLLSFTKIRQIFHCLQKMDANGNSKIWSRSWSKWTFYEKFYLAIIAISFGTREILVSGGHILDLLTRAPCPLSSWVLDFLLLGHEQVMVFFSLESVLETATFLLLVFIGTFTHSLESECGEALQVKKNNAWEENNPPSFVRLEELFLSRYTQKALNKREVKSSKKQDGEIISLLDSYFEMTAVWKHASTLTGILTLILLLEHTFTFCLNIFMALASLTRFGVDSHFLVAVLDASITISKIICVSYTSQSLTDATTSLGNKVLDLRWKNIEDKQQQTLSEVDMLSNDNSLNQIITYVRNNPLTLSALGYFTMNKAALTSIAGVIVTYLVVLVQFHVQMLQTAEQ